MGFPGFWPIIFPYLYVCYTKYLVNKFIYFYIKKEKNCDSRDGLKFDVRKQYLKMVNSVGIIGKNLILNAGVALSELAGESYKNILCLHPFTYLTNTKFSLLCLVRFTNSQRQVL